MSEGKTNSLKIFFYLFALAGCIFFACTKSTQAPQKMYEYIASQECEKEFYPTEIVPHIHIPTENPQPKGPTIVMSEKEKEKEYRRFKRDMQMMI